MPDDSVQQVQHRFKQNMKETVSPRFPGLKWDQFDITNVGTCNPIAIAQSEKLPDGKTIVMRATEKELQARLNDLKSKGLPHDFTETLLEGMKLAKPKQCTPET